MSVIISAQHADEVVFSFTVFLQRDAMCKRDLCCRPVSVRLSARLSVCLSHSLCCFQAAKDIIKISSRPEGPVILFLRPSGFTQFQGNPLTKGVKYTRVRKL